MNAWKVGDNIISTVVELPDEGDPKLGRKDRRGDQQQQVKGLIDALHAKAHQNDGGQG